MNYFLAIIDGEGVYGTFLTYGLTASFAGGAFVMFLYFWWKGRLDMDEEPKLQMMQNDNEWEAPDDHTGR